MAELRHLSSDTSADDIIEVLHDDAGVIIDNVIDSDFLQTLNNELDPFLSHDNFGRDEFTGFKTKRIGALIARSEKCRELALDPLINKSAKNFLQPYCDGLQLHFTSAVSIGPGESPQILHRDRGIWGGYLPRKVELCLALSGLLLNSPRRMGPPRLYPALIGGIKKDSLNLMK